MTDRIFYLPDLGEGLTEAEIIEWHVAAGDRVVKDQPLVTVETDKAVVEIPSSVSGIVLSCHGEPGDIVGVGEPLLEFEGSGARDDPGSVVGTLPEGAPETAPAVRASPRTRQRARELGVRLEQLAPSAPGGVVQLKDVEAAAGGAASSPDALRGVRRAMAKRMTEAGSRVVRATVTGEAEVGAWWRESPPMPRLVRAMAYACAGEPRLNSRFDDQALLLERQESVNLGIAMETDEGLFVPVLEDIGGSSAEEIGAALASLEQAVAGRVIRPDQLTGQTITLSNFGAVGGLHAEMVVIPPQVAIVGAGRCFERLVRRSEALAAVWVLPLSVTFDHRVVTGVEACRFLSALIEDLELPN